MNPTIKREWVEELCKEHKQSYSMMLGDNGEVCPLGVLVLLFQRHHNGVPSYTAGRMANSILPLEVMKWAQLPSRDPEVEVRGVGRHRITHLNDVCMCSLRTIGKAIDECL